MDALMVVLSAGGQSFLVRAIGELPGNTLRILANTQDDNHFARKYRLYMHPP